MNCYASYVQSIIADRIGRAALGGKVLESPIGD